jgi:ABC-2 type transport system permease protein
MSAIDEGAPVARGIAPARSGPVAFVRDVSVVAGRGLRALPREPAAILPALFVPIFLYVIGLGALAQRTEDSTGLDYRSFMLPTACVFSATGVSRAMPLVRDIDSGYFDRLLISPLRRPAILLGLMVVDMVLVAALTVLILVIGVALGADLGTGPLGALVFVALTSAWAVAFAGFPYAVALRTASAGSVSASMMLFYPVAFLTTSLAPRESLSGWFDAAAVVNPMTYVLDGLRSLLDPTWDAGRIGGAVLAIVGVNILSQTLAFRALAGRVRR